MKKKIYHKDGFLLPSVGIEIGTNSLVYLKTGYANIRNKGDYLEALFSLGINFSPKISLSYCQPLYEKYDFASPLQTKIYFFEAYRKILSNMKIDKYQLQIPLLNYLNRIIGLNLNWIHPFDIKDLPNENTPYCKLSLADSLSLFELSGLLRERSIVPFLKLKHFHEFQFGKGFSLLISLGSLLSFSQVPLPERFHLGNVPFYRGFKSNDFSNKVQNIPIGNENFISSALEKKFSIFPDFGLNGHGFLCSSFAYNFHKIGQEKNYLYFASIGFGLSYNKNENQIEVNTQFPLFLSENLSFYRFQIGINISLHRNTSDS